MDYSWSHAYNISSAYLTYDYGYKCMIDKVIFRYIYFWQLIAKVIPKVCAFRSRYKMVSLYNCRMSHEDRQALEMELKSFGVTSQSMDSVNLTIYE